jgi:hypothetical protein
MEHSSRLLRIGAVHNRISTPYECLVAAHLPEPAFEVLLASAARSACALWIMAQSGSQAATRRTLHPGVKINKGRQTLQPGKTKKR